MSPVRIGVMSLAHVHAEHYLTRLLRLPGIELVGFSEPDHALAEEVSRSLGVRWFRRHEELLEQRPDGVVVTSENGRHAELVELAARAGAHVLCEKPIEVSLERARAMRDACRRHGVRFMTAFPMRFDPSVRAVREQLRAGALGRVLGVNGINHSEMPAVHRRWFADRALAGGGAVMDHTVHLVDLYRWYFDAEVTSVFAAVGNPLRPGEVDVDTAGLLLLTLSNGAFASVDCSWSRPPTYPRWGHLKMEIIGERGGISVDAFAQYLTVYSARGARHPAWVNWGSDPNDAMLAEFAASIREGREPSVTWRDGYEALRVALAAYESAAGGSVVNLERTHTESAGDSGGGGGGAS